MQRKKIKSHIGLEMLEDRSVPAVLGVNLVGADLVITTDDSADSYALNLTADNTIEVIDGGGSDGVFEGVTGKVIFTSGAGADQVNLNLNGFKLDAAVEVSLGGDNDSFRVNGGGGQINNNLTVSTDGDDDHVEFQDVTIVGNVEIDSGGGNNCIIVGECNSVSITGNVDILSGDNGSDIAVSAELTGNLTITTGSGCDSIEIDQSTIGGMVTLTTGDGDNHVSLTDSTFTNDVVVTLGADDDCVSVDPVIMTGNFTLDTGAGCNDVTLEGLYLEGDLLHTTTGRDDITVRDSTLAGYISFNVTDAENGALDLRMCNTTVATFLSIVGGDHGDEVSLDNVKVGENLAFLMGAGCDEVDLSGIQVVGNLFLFGGGDQQVSISGSQILGYVTLNHFNPEPEITSEEVSEDEGSLQVQICGTTIGRFLSIIGSDGDDCVRVGTSSIGGSFGLGLKDGCDDVSVSASSIDANFFLEGTGGKELSMDHVQVNGFLSVNSLEQDVRIDVDLEEVLVGGYLSIVGGSEGDRVGLEGVTVNQNLGIRTGEGEDCVEMDGVFAAGTATLETGADSDHVKIKDSTFSGAVTIDAGDGDNCLGIETRANDTSTMFLSAFSYTGGEGNDNVNIGDHSWRRDDYGIFSGPASFEGGAGENYLDIDLAHFNEEPTINNFNTGPV